MRVRRGAVLITALLVLVVLTMMAGSLFVLSRKGTENLNEYHQRQLMENALDSSARALAFLFSTDSGLLTPNAEGKISLERLSYLNSGNVIVSPDGAGYRVKLNGDEDIVFKFYNDTTGKDAIVIATYKPPMAPKPFYVVYYFPADESVGAACLDEEQLTLVRDRVKEYSELKASLKRCKLWVMSSYNRLTDKTSLRRENGLRVVKPKTLSLVGVSLERDDADTYHPLAVLNIDMYDDGGILSAAAVSGNLTFVNASRWVVASKSETYPPQIASSFLSFKYKDNKTIFKGDGARPGYFRTPPVPENPSELGEPISSYTADVVRSLGLQLPSKLSNPQGRVLIEDYNGGEFFNRILETNPDDASDIQDKVHANRGYTSDLSKLIADFKRNMQSALEERDLYGTVNPDVEMGAGLYFFIDKKEIIYFPPRGNTPEQAYEYYEHAKRMSSLFAQLYRVTGDDMIRRIEIYEENPEVLSAEESQLISQLETEFWYVSRELGGDVRSGLLSRYLKKTEDLPEVRDTKASRILFIKNGKLGDVKLENWKIKVNKTKVYLRAADGYPSYTYISSAPVDSDDDRFTYRPVSLQIKSGKVDIGAVVVKGGLAVNGVLFGNGTIVAVEDEDWLSDRLIGYLSGGSGSGSVRGVDISEKLTGEELSSILRNGSVVFQADKFISAKEKDITIFAEGVVEVKQRSGWKSGVSDELQLNIKEMTMGLVMQSLLAGLSSDLDAYKNLSDRVCSGDETCVSELLNNYGDFDDVASDMGLNISREDFLKELLSTNVSFKYNIVVEDGSRVVERVLKVSYAGVTLKFHFSVASGKIYTKTEVIEDGSTLAESDWLDTGLGISDIVEGDGGYPHPVLPPEPHPEPPYGGHRNVGERLYNFLNNFLKPRLENNPALLLALLKEGDGTMAKVRELSSLDSDSEKKLDASKEAMGLLWDAYTTAKSISGANKPFWRRASEPDYNNSFVFNTLNDSFWNAIYSFGLDSDLFKGGKIGGMIFGKVIAVDSRYQAITMTGIVMAEDSILVNSNSKVLFAFDPNLVNLDWLEGGVIKLRTSRYYLQNYREMLRSFEE